MRSIPFLVLALAGQFLHAQDQLLPVFRFQPLNGLNSGTIRSRVVRDREGFVWVGTYSALVRYDGYGTKEYRTDPDDPHSISSNPVGDLLVDSKGRLWAGTHASGLSLYDRHRDRFINFLPHAGDSSWYGAKSLISLSEDRTGHIWMGCQYGGIVRLELPPGNADDLDSVAAGIRFTTYPLGTPENCAQTMLERDDGTVLVGTDSGLVVLNPATRAISRLHMTDAPGRRLDSLFIRCMLRDSHGDIWVGTASEGLFRIVADGMKVTNLRHRKGDDLSLRSDIIQDIVEGQRGNLWIGTDSGIDLLSPSTGQRIPYLTVGPAPRWPAEGVKLSLDREGVLWVSTIHKSGGVCVHWLSPKTQRFPLFGLPDADGSSSIPFTTVDRDRTGGTWFMSGGGVLHQIDLLTGRVLRRIDVFHGRKVSYLLCGSLVDRHGIYWYGTWGLGLFRIDLSSGRITNYHAASLLGGELVVSSIAQAEGDTLWIGAYHDGLMKFSPSSGRFLRVQGLPVGDVYTAIKDRTGKIWRCSEQDGVTVLDPTDGSIARFRHDAADPGSLSSDHIHVALEDSQGRVWVGGTNGVNLWNPVTHSFTHYTSPAFKTLQSVDPLGADSHGRLWLDLTLAGTAVLDPSTGIFREFDRTDGIRGGLLTNLPDGRVAIANWDGINVFNLDSIEMHRTPPPLVITRMWINDRPVAPPRFTSTSGPLSLQHWQNVLEFEFAAIDIDLPGCVEYQYQLEGLEKEWVSPKDRRFVRYPSLPPGDYILKVKAASSRDEWPEQEIALVIGISPPWWRTTWAYSLYGLLVISLLFGGYRLRLRQIRLKQAIELEHFQAEHLEEVDRLKSRFFSNISHEFRTPLTLILGPAQQVIDTIKDPPTQRRLRMIRENAMKLSGLVNQLLDFSSLESGMMRLQVSRGDAVQFARRVVMSFESWAERKGIGLAFQSATDMADGFFDGDKLEKILNNLMSNALKFTPSGGTVRVLLEMQPFNGLAPAAHAGEKDPGKERALVLTISDTGEGISPEHLPRIFDRFYRVDQTHLTEGTGIGLALTKELVELHRGTISVMSTPGKGSVFTLRLPFDGEAYRTEEIGEAPLEPGDREPPEQAALLPDAQSVPTHPPADGKALVLVVEDNTELRAYVRECLEENNEICEAGDGDEGYRLAVETLPDIVVSDVLMPGMDGIQLCRALKQDIRTSHVPVILLTARADIESKIEGLEIGADDYVTKPFDVRELAARVENLIAQRRQLRRKFATAVVLKAAEVAVTSLDQALLEKIMGVVEGRIADENLSVEDLAHAACLSQRQLGRKLLSLTNLTPAEFIRFVRLQRAHELLEKNTGTIAEIAFRVGFGSATYFTASFHKRFGYPPSAIQRRQSPTSGEPVGSPRV